MDFVNDVDLVPAPGGPIYRVLTEPANLFHTIIRRTVNLNDIKTISDRNFLAGIAFATWFLVLLGVYVGVLTIEYFR